MRNVKLNSIQKKAQELGEKGVMEIAMRAFQRNASQAEMESFRELIFKALVVQCDFLDKKDQKTFMDWCELDDKYRKLNEKYQKLLK